MATVSKATRGAVAGNGWTSPANAVSDNGVYATAAPAKNGNVTGDWDFDAFTDVEIPVGSTINSVTIRYQYKMSTTSSIADVTATNLNNGSASGTTNQSTEPTTDTNIDLAFSTVPSEADLKTAGSLVARFNAHRGNSNTAVTVSLDFIQITVDYTAPPPAQNVSAIGAIGTGEAFGTAIATAVAPITAIGAIDTLEAYGTLVVSQSGGGGGGTTYAADNFDDVQSNSWGSLDTGGAWSNSGTASDYQKTGSEGTHSLASATTKQSRAASVAAGEQEGNIEFRASDFTAASSQGVFWRIETRGDTGFSNGYRIEVRISGTGAVNVLLRKVTAGSAATLRTDSNVLTGVAANDWLHLKWQIDDSGSDVILRYKMWNVTQGGSEPGTWSTDLTDTAPGSPFTDPGIFQITSQVSANFTGTFPVTLGYRALTITSIGGGAPAAQNVTAIGGIASAEALGTEVVTPGAVPVTAIGAIASAEALGTPTVTIGPAAVTAIGAIASGEVFGTFVVTKQPYPISAIGAIASGEALGTPTVAKQSYPVTAIGAIASGEAFGTPVVTVGPVNVSAVGAIASAEAFGTLVVTRGTVSVTAVGAIGSGEAFGTLAITTAYAVGAVGGIGSAESLGTPTVTAGPVGVTGVGGIASGEAFGVLVVQAGVQAISSIGSIGSGETFGTLVVSPGPVSVTSAGAIASGEAFGLTVITAANAISAIGAITTGEAFGALVVTRGPVAVTGVGAIASLETFGTLVVSQTGGGAQSVSSYTIAFDSAMGSLVLSVGPVNVSLVGIPSTETFGTMQIGGISQVSLQGIPTEEAFGLLRLGLFVRALGNIPSAESFPLPIISSSYSLFDLGNIGSAEAFGTLKITGGGVLYHPKPIGFVTRNVGGELEVARRVRSVVLTGGKPYVEVKRD